MINRINPPTLAPPVLDLYAQILLVRGGTLAFVAGQVALDRVGNLVGPGDHGLQARQCFENIAAATAAVGAGPEHIARMNIHVVDHRPELVETIFGAGRDIFGAAWPIAASTFLGVQALGLPEWLVEIDAVIALD